MASSPHQWVDGNQSNDGRPRSPTTWARRQAAAYHLPSRVTVSVTPPPSAPPSTPPRSTIPGLSTPPPRTPQGLAGSARRLNFHPSTSQSGRDAARERDAVFEMSEFPSPPASAPAGIRTAQYAHYASQSGGVGGSAAQSTPPQQDVDVGSYRGREDFLEILSPSPRPAASSPGMLSTGHAMQATPPQVMQPDRLSPHISPSQYQQRRRQDQEARASPSINHSDRIAANGSPSDRPFPPNTSHTGSPKPLLLSPSHYASNAPSWDSHHTPRSQIQTPSYVHGDAANTRTGLLPSAFPKPNNDTMPNHQPLSDLPVTGLGITNKSGFEESPPISPAETDITTKGDGDASGKGGKRGKKPSGPPPLFKPSIALLFSLSNRTDKLTLLLPACLFSIASAAIPPMMTFVLGEAFDVFATFQRALSYQNALPDPVRDMSRANASLKSDMITVAIKLIVLGVLAVVTTTASLWLWVWHGERIAKRLRHAVYIGVCRKPIAWFDMGLGKRAAVGDDKDNEGGNDQENESSGGLMGRFSRETDDVRMALSSVAGRLLTSFCTIIACLAVAFWKSYQLTFVILGCAPVIVAITVVIEIMVTPLIMAERNINAAAASRVERVTSAITTVKAFNAEHSEFTEFSNLAQKGRVIYNKITMFWGLRAGAVQFMLLTMFVTGFWFGNYQVVTGKKTAGDVTIVFWSTLLASSNMQMSLPMLNILDKAKVAMAALLETAHEDNDPASRPTSTVDSLKTATDQKTLGTPPQSPVTPLSPPTYIPVQPEKTRKRGHRRANSKVKPIRELKKLHPSRFTGELALHDVLFYYPTRPAPAPPALNKVTMFLPARDTTYIVGGSGSGKSTIGSLLLGLYTLESGRIEADEQGIEWLDEHWLRGHIGMVSQGASVLFEGTVHENVALGVVGAVGSSKRKPEDVSREEVIRACQLAHFHDFVKDLPDGYDTVLSGERGASLSGGQRQRLAIARAYIRDPTVLILDEATSALDTVTRSAVHAAVKAWRRNKTTIIITHDLSPITGDDFVYVVRDGQVVEQGYRQELETHQDGWFTHLATVQATAPEPRPQDLHDEDDHVEHLNLPDFAITPPRDNRQISVHRLSMTPRLPLPEAGGIGESLRDYQQNQRHSRVFMDEQQQRRLSTASPNPSFRTAQAPGGSPTHSHAMQMTRSVSSSRSIPILPYAAPRPLSQVGSPTSQLTKSNSRISQAAMQRTPSSIMSRRPIPSSKRSEGPRESWFQLNDVTTEVPGESKEVEAKEDAPTVKHPTLVQLFKTMLPMVPSKFGLVMGLLLCIASGICTPMFSSQFAQLLAALSNPGSVNLVRVALLLLLIAGIDGLTQWGKYTVLQHVAMGWVLKMQEECFRTVLSQDKSWYDSPANIPINIVSTLVKDAEDARNLIGYVAGNLTVVLTMILLGVIWAMVVGWQLTLVGMAMGPLFVLSTMTSTRILGTYERINKAQREECSKKFYTSVANIKAIRSMSLEPVFLEKFEKSVRKAYNGGKKAAFFTGFGTGIAFFVIYVAQAIMFLVGALFIIQGSYTFQQVMQVFVLLIFSITFAGQVLQNVPQIAKAKYATADLLRLHAISKETAEAQGRMTFPVSGRIIFDRVAFSYPTRPDVKVLENVSFQIQPGECVAIVGPSGSGKSTVAALLQRLYEPSQGMIRIDGRPMPRIDSKYLRDHVAVVSQHPALFDMSIADNISYGKVDVALDDVIKAAKAAHVHDFIMTLPDGYKTHLGENAGLISGGQAQRLQIARALLRPREILLGDEITSALDAENQEAIMRTLADVKKGRTTILVTHTLATIQMCDRIIVIENGRVVQQGTFTELQSNPMGLFASLARGGEWNA